MRVGICGYPGSGKSTMFKALAPGSRADRDVAFGNIKVPDARVEFLASVFHPKKTTLAEITFVDDKVNHLDAVAPLGVRCALAAWGYNGPREHRLARSHGHLLCTLDDVEAQLFEG